MLGMDDTQGSFQEAERLKFLAERSNKFDEALAELNGKGTEFSRMLAQEVAANKQTTMRELENLWSWSKSKMVSIEQGQKLFYNDIFPDLMKKVGVAVEMSKDSATAATTALKSNERAECFVKDSRRYILILMAGLFATLVPVSIASIAKLVQDKKNQTEMIGYLKNLDKSIEVNSLLNDLDDNVRGLLFEKMKKPGPGK